MELAIRWLKPSIQLCETLVLSSMKMHLCSKCNQYRNSLLWKKLTGLHNVQTELVLRWIGTATLSHSLLPKISAWAPSCWCIWMRINPCSHVTTSSIFHNIPTARSRPFQKIENYYSCKGRTNSLSIPVVLKLNTQMSSYGWGVWESTYFWP